MRRNAMIVCLLMATTGAFAQAPEKDSLQTVGLQEVEVIATRATAHTPVAYTNLSKEQLKKQITGVDDALSC